MCILAARHHERNIIFFLILLLTLSLLHLYRCNKTERMKKQLSHTLTQYTIMCYTRKCIYIQFFSNFAICLHLHTVANTTDFCLCVCESLSITVHRYTYEMPKKTLFVINCVLNLCRCVSHILKSDYYSCRHSIVSERQFSSSTIFTSFPFSSKSLKYHNILDN